jgi:hypothetical protein
MFGYLDEPTLGGGMILPQIIRLTSSYYLPYADVDERQLGTIISFGLPAQGGEIRERQA